MESEWLAALMGAGGGVVMSSAVFAWTIAADLKVLKSRMTAMGVLMDRNTSAIQRLEQQQMRR